MSFTLGFFVIFLSLIIPGLIFRRFYFFGEFSKQFNTKDPVSHSIYFSIIPGILIQISSVILMNFVFDIKISFSKVFNILNDFTHEIKLISDDTTDFLEGGIIDFFKYSVVLFIFSGLSGYVLSRLVRSYNLDKKFKLFRFKNQWYYIFSGEILSMKKFKEAIRVTFNKVDNHDNEVLTTYADILVNIKDDIRELYTGFVVDYDLNSEDITKLDRIYLIDTYRYKRINPSDEYKRYEIGFNKQYLNEGLTQQDIPTRGQKNIPGDVFILDATNIVNLNLTFVPNILKIEENELREEAKKGKKQSSYHKISNGLIFLLLFALIFNFTNFFSLIDSDYYDFYLNNFGFFRKLLMSFLIIQFISIFSPLKNEEELYEYNFKSILQKIVGLVIMFLINIYNIIDFYFIFS
jgi:hypothetical protein